MTSLSLFHSPGRTITLRDVLHAAALRGDGPATDEPCPVRDAAEAERASEHWRVEQNLIAGEELDAWLMQRHLTHEDFLRHFRGEAAESETHRLARWWIDGSINRWAKRHAEALAALAATSTPPALEHLQHWFQATAGRFGGENGLQTFLRDKNLSAAWLAELAQIECAHASMQDELLAPAALEKALRAMHFQLHRVTLSIAKVPQAGAAQELSLQLGQNPATTLARLAEQQGFDHSEQRFFIGDLAPDFQQPFLSACEGECLPAMQARDHWRLCQLVEKQPPSLNDPEVLSRVQNQVLQQRFAELSESVIAWQVE